MRDEGNEPKTMGMNDPLDFYIKTIERGDAQENAILYLPQKYF
jgi:hypothetical protein